MTTYTAYRNSTSPAANLAIRANDFPIRITSIITVAANTDSSYYGYHTLSRRSGSTVSGGTVLTPFAVRDGSPPPTATMSYSVSSVSGTQAVIRKLETHGQLEYTTEIVLAPGSALYFAPDVNQTNLKTIELKFEELRLWWSY